MCYLNHIVLFENKNFPFTQVTLRKERIVLCMISYKSSSGTQSRTYQVFHRIFLCNPQGDPQPNKCPCSFFHSCRYLRIVLDNQFQLLSSWLLPWLLSCLL
mmetsp:Transcript_21257/g.48295  ORF Transcript_21257/g.48295 Transcript_21257/m.48295 type:complete len:101 (-) Transcript_21257:442-744(-)